jgi:hypothetical protein
MLSWSGNAHTVNEVVLKNTGLFVVLVRLPQQRSQLAIKQQGA